MHANRSYTSGHFELLIDGHASTAYLKSVDGGWVKANVIDEPIGPASARIKHSSTVDVEPISIEFGLSGAADVLDWIQCSWNQEFARRHGQVTHADFNFARTFEHEFHEALITETSFPTLDGASKEAAYLKIKLQPERVTTRKLHSPAKVRPIGGLKQKMWLSSAFLFTIDGMDCARYTNKIEGFTIKQGIKKHYIGEERYPQIEPTKIEFPNLVCTMSVQHADPILEWYDAAVVRGDADTDCQKTGSIEFLTADRKQTLFRINLFEMGIISLQIQQSTANAEQIKRIKYELYVGRMELEAGSGWG